MPGSMPPAPTIPMTDIDAVLHAWEVVEITGIRRALRAAIGRGLSGLDGTWDQAQLEARPLLKEIGSKCNRYRQSVDRLLVERQLPPTGDLEAIIAIARTRGPTDRLVCHVAMAAVYARAQATIGILQASTDDSLEFLDGLEVALEDRALRLYDLQQHDWKRAEAHCKAAGVNLTSAHPIPNPFGVGSGPCWHVTKLEVGLDG